MHRTTIRTDNYFFPTLFSDEITATFIVVKVFNKGDKRIEVCEFKLHSSRYCIFLYLKSNGILQKSPAFLAELQMFMHYLV